MPYIRVWDIRDDGVPVARMMMRNAGHDQTYPESALLLLNTECLTAAEACLIMASLTTNTTVELLTLGMLSESMYPIVSAGSQDAFDAMFVYGEDAEEAERSFTALMDETPAMLTPLLQIVQ
jgi:hypothetical protein